MYCHCATHWCKTPSTYRAAIPQWPPHFFPASMNRDRPMRLMVGAIAIGPMYFSTRPTRPEKPRTIWSREDTRMAPWICGRQVKRDATQTHKLFLCTQLNIAATRKIKTYEKKCEENTFNHHKSTTTDGFVILVTQILFCACESGTLEHSFWEFCLIPQFHLCFNLVVFQSRVLNTHFSWVHVVWPTYLSWSLLLFLSVNWNAVVKFPWLQRSEKRVGVLNTHFCILKLYWSSVASLSFTQNLNIWTQFSINKKYTL